MRLGRKDGIAATLLSLITLKNIVAGGDPATVDAVREVIEAGGNAIDGAVAGVFTAMVAESTLTSAGGGGDDGLPRGRRTGGL